VFVLRSQSFSSSMNLFFSLHLKLQLRISGCKVLVVPILKVSKVAIK